MEKDYFVMLNTQPGGITPMTDENGELAMFELLSSASEAAINNPLGAHFGYEVFERGCGVL